MTFANYMERSIIIVQDKDLSRVKVYKKGNGELVISVDLHHLPKNEAKRLVNEIIEVNHFEFSLEIIHGFHNGTVLKDMVRHELRNRRIVNRYSPQWNPGSTYLIIE
ncbi:MAG: Smr/MutS family protein [Lachnospiraceae bacterium]|nr:Smr/MutS family protein [Lachnospiraceae bacterium]